MIYLLFGLSLVFTGVLCSAIIFHFQREVMRADRRADANLTERLKTADHARNLEKRLAGLMLSMQLGGGMAPPEVISQLAERLHSHTEILVAQDRRTHAIAASHDVTKELVENMRQGLRVAAAPHPDDEVQTTTPPPHPRLGPEPFFDLSGLPPGYPTVRTEPEPTAPPLETFKKADDVEADIRKQGRLGSLRERSDSFRRRT